MLPPKSDPPNNQQMANTAPPIPPPPPVQIQIQENNRPRRSGGISSFAKICFLFILVSVVGVVVVILLWDFSDDEPTLEIFLKLPTQENQPEVVKTFRGNGVVATDSFTVRDDWGFYVERRVSPHYPWSITLRPPGDYRQNQRVEWSELRGQTSGYLYYARGGTYKLTSSLRGESNDGPWKVTIYQYSGRID